MYLIRYIYQITCDCKRIRKSYIYVSTLHLPLTLAWIGHRTLLPRNVSRKSNPMPKRLVKRKTAENCHTCRVADLQLYFLISVYNTIQSLSLLLRINNIQNQHSGTDRFLFFMNEDVFKMRTQDVNIFLLCLPICFWSPFCRSPDLLNCDTRSQTPPWITSYPALLPLKWQGLRAVECDEGQLCRTFPPFTGGFPVHLAFWECSPSFCAKFWWVEILRKRASRQGKYELSRKEGYILNPRCDASG